MWEKGCSDPKEKNKYCCQQMELCFIFLSEMCMCVMLEMLFTIPLLLMLFFIKGFSWNLFSKPRDLFLWKMFMLLEDLLMWIYLYITQKNFSKLFTWLFGRFVLNSTTLLSITPYWFLQYMSSLTTFAACTVSAFELVCDFSLEVVSFLLNSSVLLVHNF